MSNNELKSHKMILMILYVKFNEKWTSLKDYVSYKKKERKETLKQRKKKTTSTL